MCIRDSHKSLLFRQLMVYRRRYLQIRIFRIWYILVFLGTLLLAVSYTHLDVYKRQDQMNSADRIALSKEIIESGVPFSKFPQHVGYEGAYLQLINKEISMNEFNQKVTQMEKQNTNWLKLLSRNAVSQNYSLSLRGGDVYKRQPLSRKKIHTRLPYRQMFRK